MTRVVCFDVGGVLIRITRNWREAASLAGVAIHSDIPQSSLLWDAPFFVAYEGGELDDQAYFQELARYMGGISSVDAIRVHNHIMVEELPHVEEIVAKLNDLGYITACLSNTNEPHWRDMFDSGRFPVMKRLQVTIASHRIGVSKPNPGIFSAFEQSVGASGHEILFFDDSVINVAAASQYGWRAYAIDHSEPTYLQMTEVLQSVGINLGLDRSERP